MADISAEIAAFQNAVYGEDVRGAMISLANKVNNESSAAATTVAGYDTRLSDLETALTYMHKFYSEIFITLGYVATNGDIVDGGGNLNRTDYLPINLFYSAYIKTGPNVLAIAFFTEDKTFISGVVGSYSYTTYKPSIPDTAAYFIAANNKTENVGYLVLNDLGYMENDLEECLTVKNEIITVKHNDLWTHPGYITLDGSITSGGYFYYTDFLPVEALINTYAWTNSAVCNIAFYDLHKSFISGLTIEGTSKYYLFDNITIPNGAVYFIATHDTRKTNGYLTLNEVGLVNGHIKNLPKWNGFTGDFLGDSITAQHLYTDALTARYGIVVNNYGVGGTTISSINPTNKFSERISNMSTTCDFVFMLGGTNDWGLGATLGTKADTTENTFYGGLYVVLSALRTKFPLKPIVVSTILQRNWQGSGQAGGIDDNGNGVSLEQFNDAIRYMAHRYGCIVIDGFGESGICVSNIDNYTSDKLHLNKKGGTRYADFIMDKLNAVTPY